MPTTRQEASEGQGAHLGHADVEAGDGQGAEGDDGRLGCREQPGRLGVQAAAHEAGGHCDGPVVQPPAHRLPLAPGCMEG